MKQQKIEKLSVNNSSDVVHKLSTEVQVLH